MRVLKISVLATALTLALCASVFAQAAPPAGAPKPQTPPATPPAAQAAPARAEARAARAVPAGLEDRVRRRERDRGPVRGRERGLEEAPGPDEQEERPEISEKNKQLQAMTTRRDTGTAVMNDSARATLDKDIDKLQRDIQFMQTNAQAEVQDLQNELMGSSRSASCRSSMRSRRRRASHAVFSIADSGAAYVHPGLDLSAEVVKRLDAKK